MSRPLMAGGRRNDGHRIGDNYHKTIYGIGVRSYAQANELLCLQMPSMELTSLDSQPAIGRPRIADANPNAGVN